MTTQKVILRTPRKEDGAAIYQLVKSSPPLDLNSCYAYLLQAQHFSESCIVAEHNGAIVAYVSAYIPPQQPDTLFVWQVVTASAYRGTGMAATLISGLLARPACQAVRYIDTTVSPSNIASARVFRKLGERLGCRINTSILFAASDFSGAGHEDEVLFRIGPFAPANNQFIKEPPHAITSI
jgi:L-2,4-diaminobutyric acid acetyltransferase